jgi:hypothetical protein
LTANIHDITQGNALMKSLLFLLNHVCLLCCHAQSPAGSGFGRTLSALVGLATASEALQDFTAASLSGSSGGSSGGSNGNNGGSRGASDSRMTHTAAASSVSGQDSATGDGFNLQYQAFAAEVSGGAGAMVIA